MTPHECRFSNVILEGSDLVGKSTLVDALLKRMPRAEVTHSVPMRGSTEDFCTMCNCEATRWQLLRAQGVFSIKDRWYGVSDFVYNPDRDKAEFNRDCHMRDMAAEMAMYKGKVLLVVIIGSDDLITKRYMVRGDEFKTLDEILEANRKYFGLVNMIASDRNNPFGAVDVLRIDGRQPLDVEEVADQIVEFMKVGAING